jgi:hypothetical protein
VTTCPTDTLDKPLDRFGLQIAAAEDPRTLWQWMLGIDLTALDSQPQCLRAQSNEFAAAVSVIHSSAASCVGQ